MRYKMLRVSVLRSGPTNWNYGYRLKTANRKPVIWQVNTFPRGEGAPQGRMRNGDIF